MAGGSGLSSPKSMIADLLEEGCCLPITLVYGARTRDELYDHDLFVQWAQQHPNFTYVPALSAVDEAAKVALKQWEFQPAMLGKQAITVSAVRTMLFHMD